jgi:hypothetical protein
MSYDDDGAAFRSGAIFVYAVDEALAHLLGCSAAYLVRRVDSE